MFFGQPVLKSLFKDMNLFFYCIIPAINRAKLKTSDNLRLCVFLQWKNSQWTRRRRCDALRCGQTCCVRFVTWVGLAWNRRTVRECEASSTFFPTIHVLLDRPVPTAKRQEKLCLCKQGTMFKSLSSTLEVMRQLTCDVHSDAVREASWSCTREHAGVLGLGVIHRQPILPFAFFRCYRPPYVQNYSYFYYKDTAESRNMKIFVLSECYPA